MPIIGGQMIRARYTSLKLDEISSVDNPAQPGATASICKRHVPGSPPASPSLVAIAVAKYVSDEDGAHTFEEVLAENEFDEKIWPMVSALSQSIRSIMGDRAIPAADRETKVTQSVDEFLAAVRDISPTAEKRLAELISKKDGTMTIEQLTTKVAELTGQLSAANVQVETLTKRAEKAEGELTAEKTAHGETKKALETATDETLKIGDQDVKKSVVGAGNFAIFKAQEDRAQLAVLKSEAETKFPHVPGTATEKAVVLKHVASLPEEARKTFDSIINAAEKLAKNGFDRLGRSADDIEDVEKARGDFNGKVTEIAKRDGIPQHEAMTKARTEHPDLFEAMQGGTAAQ